MAKSNPPISTAELRQLKIDAPKDTVEWLFKEQQDGESRTMFLIRAVEKAFPNLRGKIPRPRPPHLNIR